ncbi:hypothetical protein PVAND_002820 [Polypedilum vanderplanki]|uniref:F-box only protein 9 n=1 Tax=Polypedilum vanderplanki TaxID=319348 RepID=A0A9J6BSA9_POLVA|nr:hypothetical protein PVAND_002820 [Polypedilum vanderplanki]
MEEDENSLDQFRKQWRRELEQQLDETKSGDSTSQENSATNLFQQAVELEKSKKYFDAIRLYRRALQLDPNIELKIYQASQAHEQTTDDFSQNSSNTFQKELSLESNQICQSAYLPGTIRTGIHISSLPIEVFLLILKYVISSDLDYKSLERFGRVCKGFFLLSRDPELWRLGCQKVWRNNITTPQNPSAWRDMFINRCRVLFDGCYICKITYQRLGENSFQDQFYRPVQIVEYFRLIRFMPSGEVLMMTSADDLQTCVNKLKNLKNISREILKGSYHYQDNHVLVVIKKTQFNFAQKYKRKNSEGENSLTFFLELEIGNTNKKNFAKLTWKNYSVSQVRNGHEATSDYDLRSSTKYPPFIFSHVKSFHNESKGCLE